MQPPPPPPPPVNASVARFAKHMKNMSHAARLRLYNASIPIELRDIIMSETNYGNCSKPIVDLAGVEFGLFKQIMERYDHILNWAQRKDPSNDHSLWLIEIIDQFIVLLKTAPVPPLMLAPLMSELVKLVRNNEYLTKSQLYNGMPPDNYHQEVDAFIQQHHATPELAEGITFFFDRVVTILSHAFDEITENFRWTLVIDVNPDSEINPETIYEELFMWPDAIDASKIISTSVFNMRYIFTKFHCLITNHKQLTRNLTFKKMLELELLDWIKRERDAAATKIQRVVRSRKHGGTKTKRSTKRH